MPDSKLSFFTGKVGGTVTHVLPTFLRTGVFLFGVIMEINGKIYCFPSLE
jgi:hypothetical protein